MRIEDVGVDAGAVVAVITAVGLLYSKVVLPVFRGLKRLGQMADQFIGDRDHPGVLARLARVEAKQDDHVATYHPAPARNGGPPSPSPVGGRHHERR